jgi:dTDP-4-dehydrorhamnose 3,5-epimerase
MPPNRPAETIQVQFQPTEIHGAWLVEPEQVRDDRGFFARTFCVDEFGARGLETSFPQHSVSHTARKGSLRGMHFQRAPHEEVKLVRCSRGAIWDVMVDLRPRSPSYRRWQGFELSSGNGRQLYIPKGVAHGFQTLTDDVEVGYLISERYRADAGAGVRYDDPAFGIAWPLPVSVISPKDAAWPDFRP